MSRRPPLPPTPTTPARNGSQDDDYVDDFTDDENEPQEDYQNANDLTRRGVPQPLPEPDAIPQEQDNYENLEDVVRKSISNSLSGPQTNPTSVRIPAIPTRNELSSDASGRNVGGKHEDKQSIKGRKGSVRKTSNDDGEYDEEYQDWDLEIAQRALGDDFDHYEDPSEMHITTDIPKQQTPTTRVSTLGDGYEFAKDVVADPPSNGVPHTKMTVINYEVPEIKTPNIPKKQTRTAALSTIEDNYGFAKDVVASPSPKSGSHAKMTVVSYEDTDIVVKPTPARAPGSIKIPLPPNSPNNSFTTPKNSSHTNDGNGSDDDNRRNEMSGVTGMVEELMINQRIQGTGDKGNPSYAKELQDLNKSEAASHQLSSNKGCTTNVRTPPVPGNHAPGIESSESRKRIEELKRTRSGDANRSKTTGSVAIDDNPIRFSGILRKFEEIGVSYPEHHETSVKATPSHAHNHVFNASQSHSKTSHQSKPAMATSSCSTDDLEVGFQRSNPWKESNVKEDWNVSANISTQQNLDRYDRQDSAASNEDNCTPTEKRFASTKKDIDLPQDPMSSYAWYFGNIDRDQCERMLERLIHENGTYVVRKSRHGGSENPYTLSVVYQKHIYHLLIRIRPDQKFALGRKKPDEKVFSTVPEMISFHQNNFLELIGDEKKKTVSGTVNLKRCPSKLK